MLRSLCLYIKILDCAFEAWSGHRIVFLASSIAVCWVFQLFSAAKRQQNSSQEFLIEICHAEKQLLKQSQRVHCWRTGCVSSAFCRPGSCLSHSISLFMPFLITRASVLHDLDLFQELCHLFILRGKYFELMFLCNNTKDLDQIRNISLTARAGVARSSLGERLVWAYVCASVHVQLRKCVLPKLK